VPCRVDGAQLDVVTRQHVRVPFPGLHPPVLPGDLAEDVEARVHHVGRQAEHRLLRGPKAVREPHGEGPSGDVVLRRDEDDVPSVALDVGKQLPVVLVQLLV